MILPGKTIHSAPKINPDFCIIDWKKNAVSIHNFIRGLSPYPCAKSTFENKSNRVSFKIYESQPEVSSHNYKPGHIVSDGKHTLKIACEDGFIRILNIQAEGKLNMNIDNFLRGFKIGEYSIPVS